MILTTPLPQLLDSLTMSLILPGSTFTPKAPPPRYINLGTIANTLVLARRFSIFTCLRTCGATSFLRGLTTQPPSPSRSHLKTATSPEESETIYLLVQPSTYLRGQKQRETRSTTNILAGWSWHLLIRGLHWHYDVRKKAYDLQPTCSFGYAVLVTYSFAIRRVPRIKVRIHW